MQILQCIQVDIHLNIQVDIQVDIQLDIQLDMQDDIDVDMQVDIQIDTQGDIYIYIYIYIYRSDKFHPTSVVKTFSGVTCIPSSLQSCAIRYTHSQNRVLGNLSLDLVYRVP